MQAFTAIWNSIFQRLADRQARVRLKTSDYILTGTAIEKNGVCLNVLWDDECFDYVSDRVGVITPWCDFEEIEG